MYRMQIGHDNYKKMQSASKQRVWGHQSAWSRGGGKGEGGVTLVDSPPPRTIYGPANYVDFTFLRVK